MAKTAAAEKAKPADAPKKVVRLDFENIEVKRMIVEAKKSGLLHIDKLNEHLVIEGISAEEIEILYARLSEMGISVHDQRHEETLGPKTLARTSTTAVKGGNSKEELDRTDDPVRMYLREMGVVELLSREGEIAIALSLIHI